MTEADTPLAAPTSDGSRISPLIDHTALRPAVTREEIGRLCAEARFYKFASVCVPPCMVEAAVNDLAGARVAIGTVIGFPLGFSTTRTKAWETSDSLRCGAQEFDMVLCIPALKHRDTDYVLQDIRAVVHAAQACPVKVILETSLLTHDEKVLACHLAMQAGARFVKTSTGFAGGGATVEDVRLMRRAVGPDMGVKASGGIRTMKETLRMVEAGANRIGTSSGVAIVTDVAAGRTDDVPPRKPS